ncbi:MAG: hypothetical protein C0490_14855 [Marivirga sp.]|nr:hypothetical protein [Marivirga sp.]
MKPIVITHLFFVSLSLCSTIGVAQTSATVTLKGYVFVDKNNNGIRDKNEIGVKDVLISDQNEIVETNAEGYYELVSEGHNGVVYVSQPNGFKVKGSFWKHIQLNVPNLSIDFALLPAPNAMSFTFIHASDPHLSEQSLPRLEKLKAIVDSIQPSFVLMTGDLVKDALRVSEKEATAFYELYVKTINRFSVPVWNVPGNHEIFGIERHKSLISEKHPLYGKKMYRHYLGPDYYSFTYGGVHFIGLNSVDYHDLWYYGHIDSTQLQWLKKESSLVSKQTPIVTFNHIPFYSGGMSMEEYSEEEPGSALISINGKKHYRHVVTNAPAIIEILNDHNYPVALAGHYHFAQKFSFESDKQKTEFHQTGAVVGPASGEGFKCLRE